MVDTNETLRQRVLRLVALGCSQKILASKMGMVPATFSRWLNQKAGISPARTSALDGFNAYVQELREALSDTDVHRQPVQKQGSGFMGELQRSMAATNKERQARARAVPRQPLASSDRKKARRE